MLTCPLLVTLAGLALAQMPGSEYDIGVSETEVMESLDYSIPGLAAVKAAWDAGDLPAARHELAEYLRARSIKTWTFSPHEPRTDVPHGAGSLKGTRDMLARTGTFTQEWWLPNGELDWLKDPNHGNMARAYFLEAVGRAYWQSERDERIAGLWVQLLRSWLRQCPKSTGNQDYWNTLVTGIRMRSSWPTPFHHFLLSPTFTDEDIILYLRSTIEQSRHLRDTHRVTGNWLTFAMVGLYTSGVVFPELSEAGQWRQYAIDTALGDLERGYLPDGMGVELSPGYHNLFYNYLRIYNLATAVDRADEPGVRALADRCERLFDPYVHLCAPDRTLPQYQDGARVQVVERLREALEHYPAREDFRWLATDGQEGAPPQFTSTMLPYAGYFAMRSGWERDANYLGFDAGPIGWKHCHEDKLSIVMWAYGRPVIFDPARGEYSDTPLSHYTADTFSHSTVLVDNRPQRRRWSTPDPSQMPYRPVADVRWTTTPEHDSASGVYDDAYGKPGPSDAYPYQDGSDFYEGWGKPAIHHRRITFAKPDVFVVADTLVSRDGESHGYDLRWQLPTTSWRIAQDGLTVETTDEGVPNLAIIPLLSAGLTVSGASAQMEPELLGWSLGPDPTPATTIRHQKSGDETVQLVTLLLPLRAGEAAPGHTVAQTEDGTLQVTLGDGRVIAIDLGQGTEEDVRVEVGER